MIELRVSGHCLSTSLSPKCTTVVTFYVGFAKHLGPEMPYYHTMTKRITNSCYHIHSGRKEEKRTIPGKMYVVVNFVFVQKE